MSSQPGQNSAVNGEAFSRLVLERMPQGCAHCQMLYRDGEPADWIYLAVNPAFERLTGLRPKAGSRVSELVPGLIEAHREILRCYHRVARGGPQEAFESYVKPMARWLSITVFNAGPDEFICIFDNITDRKQAEESARDSQERYRKVFDLSPDPVTLSRVRDGILVEVSPAWCALTGIPAADALGRTAEALGLLVEPEVRARFVNELQEAGSTQARSVQIRARSGESIQLLVSSTVITLEGERLLLTVAKEVSSRHRAEMALRESEARFRAVSEGSPVALFLHQKGRFTYLNPAAVCLLKAADPAELIGQPILDRVHPEDREQVRRRVLDAHQAGADLPLVQERLLALDGTVVDVAVQGREVRFDGRDTMLVFAQDITVTKQIQDANARLLREQAIILENANVGISIVVDRRQVWVNTWMERTFGYSSAEMVGASTRMFYADDASHQRMGQEAYAVLASGATYETVQLLHPKYGPPLWIHYNGRALDPADPGQGTLWILTDITRQKQDQDALRHSEERFRAMFEVNLAPKLIIDPDSGFIIDANSAASRFYGYSLEELRGRPIADLNLLPEDQVMAAMAQARDRGLLHFEFQHRLADGSIREVEVYSSPVPAGARTLLYSIIHDITDRKLAESALAQSETRFRQVFEGSPSAMSVTRVETGQLLQVNDAWLSVFGWTRAQALGRTLMDLGIYAQGEDREALLYYFRQHGIVADWPLEARCQDGTRKFLRIALSTILQDGEPCYLAVLVDHTALHQAEASLIRINQDLEQRVLAEVTQRMAQERMLIHQSRLAAMGEMIGNIAHQWRQPLSSLGMLLGNIRDARRYGQLTDEYLESSYRTGDRLIQKMSSTITDFMGFFRPDKEPVQFSLKRQAEEAIRLLRPTQDYHGISVVIEGPEDCRVLGFPNEFSQVILNLLTNAQEAITAARQPEGRIHLQVSAAAGLAELRFADNGGGIKITPPERVFEPYLTDKPSGTGLGLYMSRMILEQSMAGTISVQNGPDGAEFRITLPLLEPDPAP